MELTKQQLAAVQTTASKVVVVSAPASGKTRVLTERIKHLLDIGVDPHKIVAITFTVSASQEMAERLGNPRGLFIGTIHAYANYILKASGIDTSVVLDDEKFDQLFPLVEKHLECIQPVEHLLLDEAQDSTELQFNFLLKIVRPKNYFLVGDYRQSIFLFAGADPQYLMDLMNQEDVTTYALTENYRNGSAILDFAKSIINLAGYEYRDWSVAKRGERGRVVEVEYSPIAIAKTIKKYGNFGSWFVLTRTNDQLEEIMGYLQKYEVPCVSFKRAQINNKELYTLMKQDKVKVLTIHTSKGLEADNVVVIGAKFYNLEEKCISYVAATRARNLLVWARMPTKVRRANMVSNWEK